MSNERTEGLNQIMKEITQGLSELIDTGDVLAYTLKVVNESDVAGQEILSDIDSLLKTAAQEEAVKLRRIQSLVYILATFTGHMSGQFASRLLTPGESMALALQILLTPQHKPAGSDSEPTPPAEDPISKLD